MIYGLPTDENNVIHVEYIVHVEAIPGNDIRDVIPGEIQKHDATPKDIARITGTTTNFASKYGGLMEQAGKLFNFAGQALPYLSYFLPQASGIGNVVKGASTLGKMFM